MSAGAPMVDVLLLAGGASRRMNGRDKLLEEVAGQPLLHRIAAAATAAGAREVVAVLPCDRPERGAVLTGLALRVVESAAAAEGMGGSLRAGVGALRPGWRGVLIVLADMPEITADDLATLIDAFDGTPDRILRACSEDGTPGHPVLFGAAYRPALLELSGDRGARALMAGAGDALRLVPLPGRRAVVDLDTPEEWEAWRAGIDSGV